MFLTQFATWFNSFFPRHRMTLKRFQWNTFFYYVTFLLHSESQKVRCGFAFDNLDRFCLSTRKREFIANSRFDTCAVEFGQCVREHVRSRRTKIEIKTLHNAKINNQKWCFIIRRSLIFFNKYAAIWKYGLCFVKMIPFWDFPG
jgi:hypothetical protein